MLDALLQYENVKIQIIVPQLYDELELDENIDYLINPIAASSQRFKFLKNISLYIRTVKNNDLVIFGGGTSLFETDNTKYKSLLVKYIVLLINVIFFKRPILHLGVGIGNVKTSLGKFCLGKILNYSDEINLRERKSYEKALSYTKESSKVSLGNDLAYLQSFIPKIKSETYNIGMSLFQYYGYISNEKSKADVFYENCKNVIQEMLNKDTRLHIHLFAFQKGKGGNDEDFNFKLKADLTNPRLHVHPYSSDTERFVEDIKSMDLCIGMRLHFLILSVLHGIPIIGLNYQPKIKNELLSLGLENFCLEIDDVLTILSFLDSFIEDRDFFYLMYADSFNEVKSKNNQASNILSSLLSSYLQ